MTANENTEQKTWTFYGHWEGNRIVVEYVIEGEVADDREDTGEWPEGLWAAAGTGATIEEAQADAVEEYEADARRLGGEDDEPEAGA